MLKLLSPFRYFLLENKEKQRIDLWPTVILSITLTVMFVFFDTANFFAPNGFMSGLAALTSSLTGFYVAALVAAATFNHPDLDVEIKYGPIYLDETDSDGIDKKRALTRRELICIIFGYLSCSALLFAVYANLGVSISHSVSVYLTNISSLSQKLTGVCVMFFSTLWVSHIVVASFLGIYYLTSKLFKHNSKVLTRKKNQN